jgi:hypothetical protein
MLFSPDASLESARWLAANLQLESQRDMAQHANARHTVADSMHSWLSTTFSRPVADNGGLAGGPMHPGS